MIEDLPDAVLVVDRSWIIRFANAEARQRLNLPHTGGAQLWEVMPEAIEQVRDKHYRRAMEEGVAVRFEQYSPRDGVWYVVRARGREQGLLITLTDVTDLKRSEEELREREDRYRLLFDRNPMAMYAYEVEGFRFVMVNDAIVDQYGYSRDELLQMTLFDIHPPEDAEKLRDLVQRIARNRLSYSGVWRHRKKDGTIVSVEVSSRGFSIAGRWVRVAAAVDVTERLNAQHAMAGSERRYRTLVETAGSVIICLDVDRRVTEWNDEAERLSGRRREEAMGQDYFQLCLPPEHRETVAAVIHRVMVGQVTRGFEAPFCSTDDSPRLCLWNVCRQLDDAGNPIGVIAVGQDITDRNRAEDALRSSENLYRTLGEAMPQLMWSMRPDGNYEYTNARFTAVTGLTAEEANERGWAAFVHPEDLPEVMEAWRQACDRPRPGQLETRFRRVDGSYRWFLARTAPLLDPSGRLVKWVGVAIDIDELKRAQEELEQAKDAAEAANDAKDQFLAVLSHELRTPLTPVLLTASALQLEPGIDPELRESLEMISEQIQLEARLIDDLLDLTRISRGKFMLSMKDIDAHHVVRRSIEVWQPTIAAQNVMFSAELNATKRRIHADAGRLQQLLGNLLSNAAKFSSSGGSITIRTWNEPRPGASAPGESVPPALNFVVEVSDTGVGIDPEMLPRIFNAFEQGERSITRRFGGLGLGLTIGKTIAEMHGGSLSAMSEGRDRGATLTLRLPVLMGHQTIAPPPAPAPKPVRRIKVMVVDDHEPTLRMMSRLLRSLGHDVSSADSAEAALKLAKQDCPDLLISDIGMPNQSGWALLEELRRICSAPPAAIAVSGYGTDDDLRRSREAGFAEHLVKPVDIERLRTVIDHTVSTNLS